MECGGEFVPNRDIYFLEFFYGNQKAFVMSVKEDSTVLHFLHGVVN